MAYSLLHIVDERSSDGPTGEDLSTFVQAAGVASGVPESWLVGMRALRDSDLVRWAIDQRPDLVRERVAVARRTVLDLLLYLSSD